MRQRGPRAGRWPLPAPTVLFVVEPVHQLRQEEELRRGNLNRRLQSIGLSPGRRAVGPRQRHPERPPVRIIHFDMRLPWRPGTPSDFTAKSQAHAREWMNG
jgi:hypothetical protein